MFITFMHTDLSFSSRFLGSYRRFTCSQGEQSSPVLLVVLVYFIVDYRSDISNYNKLYHNFSRCFAVLRVETSLKGCIGIPLLLVVEPDYLPDSGILFQPHSMGGARNFGAPSPMVGVPGQRPQRESFGKIVL